MDETEATPAFEGWAVVELFGHRKLAGRVSEAEIAGAGFVKLDVPGPGEKVITQFYNPKAIYELTPCTEEVARALAKRYQPEPIQRFELPPMPAPGGVQDADVVDDEDDADPNDGPF
jgi:hypothetical protein